MPLIGYARVSTEDQTPLPQSQALKSAGCAEIHEEQASGGNRARPVLARVLERIGKGDTLVVVRIDRLARSLSHLLEVIERLEAKGAFFRSLTDPIDTSSPQGKFTLQVLGAAAEFERALIRERTKAGLASARTKGRVGGNPGPARPRSGGAAQGEAGAAGRLHGATERDGAGLGAPCPPPAARHGLGRCAAHRQRPPAPRRVTGRKAGFCARSTPMSETASCPTRCWAAPAAAKPTTACPPSSLPSRARTPTSRFRRSAPAGSDARAHAPRADKLAAVIGEDAAGAG